MCWVFPFAYNKVLSVTSRSEELEVLNFSLLLLPSRSCSDFWIPLPPGIAGRKGYPPYSNLKSKKSISDSETNRWLQSFANESYGSSLFQFDYFLAIDANMSVPLYELILIFWWLYEWALIFWQSILDSHAGEYLQASVADAVRWIGTRGKRTGRSSEIAPDVADRNKSNVCHVVKYLTKVRLVPCPLFPSQTMSSCVVMCQLGIEKLSAVFPDPGYSAFGLHATWHLTPPAICCAYSPYMRAPTLPVQRPVLFLFQDRSNSYYPLMECFSGRTLY